MDKINILLIDDHEIFRNGVKHLINNEPDMVVVDEAISGREGLEKGLTCEADVILLDISMPDMSGLEVARQLINKGIKAAILFFSLYDREEYVLESLKIGTKGYILKDAPNVTFLKAVRHVYQGNFFYSGDLTNVLVQEYKKLSGDKNPEEGKSFRQVHLSAREIEIVKLIHEGKSNKDLASIYNVSTRTIEAHRLNIMRKLGVKQIEAAIKVAIEKKMIS